jgi:hypothetical protein
MAAHNSEAAGDFSALYTSPFHATVTTVIIQHSQIQTDHH